MNNILKIILAYILIMNTAFPRDIKGCEANNVLGSSAVDNLSLNIVKMNQSICNPSIKKDDHLLHLATGCIGGTGRGIGGAINGIFDLFKLLIVEAPSWIWNKTSSAIEDLIRDKRNPFELANAIAEVNLKAHDELWEKAKDYWEAFKKFSQDFYKELVLEIEEFPCLPLKKQSEIICKGVTEVFLLVVSPKKIIDGAKWTIETGRALSLFIKETKSIQDLKKLSIANKLEIAAQKLKETALKSKEIFSLRNSKLTEAILPNGEKVLYYDQKIKGPNGKVTTVQREVPLDAKTQSIDANSTIGKEIMSEVAKSQAGTGTMIFIDVNHLGKVNYFKEGTQAGDDYLASVADSLRKTLRPGDIIFKNGGDELVVVFGSNDPKVVKNISQRMMNEVDSNPKTREIFRNEVIGLKSKFKEMNVANHLNDLPLNFKNGLSADDLELATKNFKRFKELKKAEYLEAIKVQATYRGSISVGAATIKADRPVSEILQKAEKQAALVKAEYKTRYGHDVSKYNIEASQFPERPRKGPPIALDPE